MAHYAVKIIRRIRPGETWGWVVETIEFDAPDDTAAQQQALGLIEGIDWEQDFAALEGHPGDFRTFWGRNPHA